MLMVGKKKMEYVNLNSLLYQLIISSKYSSIQFTKPYRACTNRVNAKTKPITTFYISLF